MKYIVATIAVVAMLASASLAGLNPDCKVFVTFADTLAMDYQDVLDEVRVDPAAYTAGVAYFGMCDYADWTTLSIRMAVDADVSAPASYSSLLPGGLSIGVWDDATGITISSTRSITPAVDGPFKYFAKADLFFLGVAGEVKILDHADYPRWVVDGQDGLDYYCQWTNAGVLMDPTPVEEECFGDVPVESRTWGGIKALYR